ncbi:MAG: trypsin-like peptidase domain-containing protein [Trueperaceae bacterium]|nr:trypsin-like peptidase domain-containing protein [Truepera sp.]HRQ10756.1 trypsin-like peptidase domain-containing protein [Trueperaceae bacterium]
MRNRRLITILGIGVLLAAGAALWLPGRPVVAQSTSYQAASALLQDEQNTVDIVNKWGPSVVAINVEVRGSRVSQYQDILPFLPPQFRDMFPPSGTQVEQSSGSGFVVGTNEIVTNYHVVKDALVQNGVETADGATIKVVFANVDDEYDAKVVGADPDYDVALLQLTDGSKVPSDAQPLELADSTKLQVGQKVIAIGNPFGLQSSVSQGIVSGIGRELQSIGQIEIPMVQTDAAINPGNSGGPLLDSAGRLVGVNTMIVPGMTSAGSAGNIGIGFAVPSELLSEALPLMRQGGLVGVFAQNLAVANGPRIGVQIVAAKDFPAEARKALNMPDTGLVIFAVEPGSPAAEAGLQGPTFEANIGGKSFPAGGDIIMKADGHDLTTGADIQKLLVGAKAGDVMTLEVWNNGATRTVKVTLAVVPPSGSN